MPGDFFKYRYGYINLRDNRLYFTHTGNWSEVRKLDQLKELESGTSVWRRSRMALFVLIASIGILAFGITKAWSTGVWIGALAGALFSVWKLFQNMSPEMGRAFWLSRERVEDVLPESDGVRIVYQDLDGQADTVTVGGVEEESRLLLTRWIESGDEP